MKILQTNRNNYKVLFKIELILNINKTGIKIVKNMNLLTLIPKINLYF